MVENLPAWVRIGGIVFAVLLIPAVNVGERIYTWAERKWRDRVRRFRPKS
jgi:hypothetical protein